MSDKEQELQKLAMQANAYRANAEEIQTQMRTINSLLQENQAAKQAIENLAQNQDTLFSIGSGIYAKAKPSSEKLLVQVGGRIVVEKTIEQTKAFLENKNNDYIKALTRLQEELEKIDNAMNALNQQAESLQ